MISKTKFLTLAIAIFLFASCGEDVDPTQGEAKIVMKAQTELGTINPGARVAATEIEFKEARIGVTEIELELLYATRPDDDDDDDDYDDDEIEFEGQFTVDLLKGTSTPDFGIADLLPGTYEEIEIDIEPIMDDGNSVFLAFQYKMQADSEPVMVEISSKKEIDIEIEKKSGIEFSGGSLSQILILFDLDKILSGIDFSKANVDSDGVIRINSSSNSGMLSSVLSNFYTSCKAGKDDDGDFEFDFDDDDDDDDEDDD
jgi:hypothetical protein